MATGGWNGGVTYQQMVEYVTRTVEPMEEHMSAHDTWHLGRRRVLLLHQQPDRRQPADLPDRRQRLRAGQQRPDRSTRTNHHGGPRPRHRRRRAVHDLKPWTRRATFSGALKSAMRWTLPSAYCRASRIHRCCSARGSGEIVMRSRWTENRHGCMNSVRKTAHGP